MAKPSEVETGMLVGGEVNEPVGPVLSPTRSHVAWKMFMVSVATLGLAVLGRSVATWAAAEAGSHSQFEITAEALQNKYVGSGGSEEVCYANSELQDECTGWGDPHFSKRFHNLPHTDNYQLGVYPLAKSTDGTFELQGFQCLAGWSATGFAAFAMKINGVTATYLGSDTANLEWHGVTPPEGITCTGTPLGEGGLTIKSPNLCQKLWIKKDQTNKGLLGYMLNFGLSVSSAAPWGICGAHTVSEVLPSKRLFNHAEMLHLCQACKIESNCEGFHAETQPQDVANLCRNKGIQWATAVEKCKIPSIHMDFRPGCVFDYCATGGDGKAIDNAEVESLHYQKPA
eukprot:CAMPEP_0172704682 /NCGR_PEP_ID=MMETSP1074-20121228/41861_1 /TAXON_ID=2916 /ORGANISM="Ceratium fusus, Strain PA161109" /LENGTH=341 /DNA_ID=CAMNT_0013526889 /DNA_START=57 /DNA_END=1082 /DNA_ORIENTATION=+